MSAEAPSLLRLTDTISIPAPEDGETVRFDADAAQLVKDFIGLLPFGQNEWAGRPFQLLPWETEAIDKFYGVAAQDPADGSWLRYRQYLYIEIPKKNGKSELAAALGLYHLLADGEALPNVGIFAADKDNASIIYNAAKYMVENSCLGQPEHAPIAWARDSRREIRTKYGGVMKVYSSDAQTKHGYSFSAVIFDELHAQPDRRLWDVVTTGSGDARRQPAYIVLTTAGDDPDRSSIGWEVHEKCRRLLNWRAGTPESETDRDDPAWCPIMYGISVLTGDDPDRIAALDIYDPELWKQCNPSLGATVKLRTVRQHARSARQSEAQERLFRWLRLNQWVAVKSVGWVPLTIYDKTQWNGDAETLRGKTCFGGLDLSSTTDLTAFVLVFPVQPGLDTAVTLWRAWLPDSNIEERERQDHAPYRDWERARFLTLCRGDLVDYPDVEAAVLEAAERYDLEMLGVDPYCKLTEFGDDQEVLALLEGFYGAAEGYMAQAGISPPPEGTARRAQYDLCINYLVLNSWDNRDMTYVSTVVADNPVFRRMMNQLKLTEPQDVSKSDTSTGEEVQPDGEASESGGAADGGDLPADGPDIG